jgi:hypothetical protein
MAAKKRSPFGDTTELAAQARSKSKEAPAAAVEWLTTAIHLRRDQWLLLRSVAFQRAMKRGGRPSVSALIVDLIDKNRAELEREAAG